MKAQIASVIALATASSVLACGSPEQYKRHIHKEMLKRQNPAAAALPTATYPGVPPLSSITSGMPVAATPTLFTTFAAGATAPVPGAPAPTAISVASASWPTPDVVPPTNGAPIQHWIQQLASANIPNIPVTVEQADCGAAGNAANYQNAKQNGWWYCGQWTQPSDISTCQNKNTWGITYDDGPSDYTPTLLKYLNDNQLKSTFFVIGSRAFYNPLILQTEYLLGHAISVHTWSHPALTTLTNEQIVAELGYTMLFIKSIIGVTPSTFRPPYGDIDNRVRAVAKMMGLTPILWTSIGQDIEFDTNDWMIPGGTATGLSSYASFESILGNASTIDTGFIVLEHDLYQQTVDMAVGYFLPEGKAKGLTQQPVHQCLGQSLAAQYIETAGNAGNSSSGTGSNSTSASGSVRPTGTAPSSGKNGGSSSTTVASGQVSPSSNAPNAAFGVQINAPALTLSLLLAVAGVVASF